LAALNAHDPDRIAGCVAEDFVNEHTSARGHSLRGRAAYRSALDRFLADFADLRYDVVQLLVDGDRAAAEYRMSFRMVSAGGRAVSIRGVFLFRVDDAGRIAHRVDFWDSAEVDRQLA
jgi:steroid delta-isomerase-like uncharacterized protein